VGSVPPGLAAGPAPEVQRRLQELEERHAAAVAAVAAAQQQLQRWQTYLATQAEQMRADAQSVAGASAQLRAVLGG
jgi:hypothetical protein